MESVNGFSALLSGRLESADEAVSFLDSVVGLIDLSAQLLLFLLLGLDVGFDFVALLFDFFFLFNFLVVELLLL